MHTGSHGGAGAPNLRLQLVHYSKVPTLTGFAIGASNAEINAYTAISSRHHYPNIPRRVEPRRTTCAPLKTKTLSIPLRDVSELLPPGLCQPEADAGPHTKLTT